MADRPAASLHTWAAPGTDLQAPAAAAVVIPTILRPSLAQALKSVFAQDLGGRVHVLVGIDAPAGPASLLDEVCAAAPSHVVVQALYPGFSTSVRHGGPWPARDGGTLRSILSYMANAELVAYLDDDNWWAADHLSTLARTIAPVDWAFSLRWFVHPETLAPVGVDQWESVGPDAGIFRERFGGFVDPNCLMIKRGPCAGAIPWWTTPLKGDDKGMSADRHVFHFLRANNKAAGTGRPSVYYRLDPNDGLHARRVQQLGEGYLVASRRSVPS